MTDDFIDVIIVGAGLSGIGAACHLSKKCPDKNYLILEGRDSIGGTWDLFRYPGIRSDSDMHTLGYEFKPWLADKAIADGPAILKYIKEAAGEYGVEDNIQFNQQVAEASWSTEKAEWSVTAIDALTGESRKLRCNFLLMCSGYYSYTEPHAPDLAGIEQYRGELVHPQRWPEDLEYNGKKIVVIGSGATAVTLVPSLSELATHVTMLQRSPSYIVSLPAKDRIANVLRKILPEKLAYRITRWKNISFQQFVYGQTRRSPAKVKAKLLKMVGKELGPGYDIDTHFNPTYDPWDQRLCLVPDGDLFAAIRGGRASVETGQIETFTERGIRLKSGQELDADIVVTATGLKLCVLGDARFWVDGKPVDFAETFSYKSMMFSDVPNLVSTFGYINASWTLRADVIANYACRLINYMTATKTRQCTPRLGTEFRDMPARPWIENFSSGYMQRSMHMLPKQGDRHPWLNPQNYRLDKRMIERQDIPDNVLEFRS